MISGRIFESLMVTGGLSVLNPKLRTLVSPPPTTETSSAFPTYKSNILAEYRLPVLTGAFFNFDWQHVGRRADRRHQQRVHAAVQHLRFRRPLHHEGLRKADHLARHGQQRDECASTGRRWAPAASRDRARAAIWRHLGDPRLITASDAVQLLRIVC